MSIRWFAGIHITNDCRRIEAALVGVHGRGDGAPIECRKSMSFDLPAEIADCFRQGIDCAKGRKKTASNRDSGFARLSAELASVQEEALDELFAESGVPRQDILAVGILDPGLWESATLPRIPSQDYEEPEISNEIEENRIFRSLSCPELLAERTGMNVIDSFPARDLAAGGSGGPLLCFPAWIVLCSEHSDRLFLDLGKTAKWTYFPRPVSANAYERIEFRELVPCGSLLDELTIRMTRGEIGCDSGGHLSTQGKFLPELQNLWKGLRDSHRFSAQSWNPEGISAAPFLELAKENAQEKNWAFRDILCTGVHFVADCIEEAVEVRFSSAEIEILFSGGAVRHGFLMNRLRKNLGSHPHKSLKECGVSSDSFESVCVAILTLLFSDRIAAAIPNLTGAQTARVLGRLTPGNPLQWNRLLAELSQAQSGAQSLRNFM